MAQPAPEINALAKVDFAGYGLAIGGAALFSSKSIVIKLLYQIGISADTALALRMIVALPFYLAIILWLLLTQKNLRVILRPALVARAALVGILGYYVASYLDFLGLKFLTAEYERLVLFTYPFFTLALGVVLFGDKMNWRVLPALVTSYSGLLVIFGWHLATNPHGLFAGTFLVLGSALALAFYQHFAKREMALIGSRAFTCIAMSAAGIAAIGQNLLTLGLASYGAFTGRVWLYGLCLGLVCTVLPSFLLNGAIQRIGPRATASTASTGPIMTIALAVAVLGEPFTLYHAIGTSLVIAGSAMFTQAERRRPRVLAVSEAR